MAALVAIGTLLIGALFGAAVGFYFRAAEFRRDQRLKVYGDFIAAFLAIGHEGAGGASLYMTHGESLFGGDNREKLAAIWPALSGAMQSFEDATARLRLVASRDARAAAADLQQFIDLNVRQMPPLRPFFPDDHSHWGDAAEVGPSQIDAETVRLAHEFADRVSPDVTPRRDSEGGWRQRWRKRRDARRTSPQTA